MAEYYNYKDYDEYLLTQVKRAKRTRHATREGVGRREWIYKGMLEHNVNIYSKSVLCLGARDPAEMEFFRNKGYEVCGIDLYDYRGIIKCDMNRIYEHPVLRDKRFDIVYSNDVMEHCWDLEGFVKGLNLVCRKYFVCFCTVVEKKDWVINGWDCARHFFMERVRDEELCRKDIGECFKEFDVIFNKFYDNRSKKKRRLFFILKKKNFEE